MISRFPEDRQPEFKQMETNRAHEGFQKRTEEKDQTQSAGKMGDKKITRVFEIHPNMVNLVNNLFRP